MTQLFDFGDAVVRAFSAAVAEMRGSGRSTDMVTSYSADTLYVFARHRDAYAFVRAVSEQKNLSRSEICTFVWDPRKELSSAFSTPYNARHKKRVVFDHNWLEQFYAHEIAAVSRRLSVFERIALGK